MINVKKQVYTKYARMDFDTDHIIWELKTDYCKVNLPTASGVCTWMIREGLREYDGTAKSYGEKW